MKDLVLLSGGVDSLVIAEQSRRRGELCGLVFVDMAHPSQIKEGWKAFSYHGEKQIPLKALHVFGLNLGDMANPTGAAVVPSRNMVLLSVAQNVASEFGATRILIGCNKTDEADYQDCRRGSLEIASQAFVAMGGIPVVAPLIEFDKTEIMRMAADLGISENDFWSCYQNTAQPCGKCNSCLEIRNCLT